MVDHHVVCARNWVNGPITEICSHCNTFGNFTNTVYECVSYQGFFVFHIRLFIVSIDTHTLARTCDPCTPTLMPLMD